MEEISSGQKQPTAFKRNPSGLAWAAPVPDVGGTQDDANETKIERKIEKKKEKRKNKCIPPICLGMSLVVQLNDWNAVPQSKDSDDLICLLSLAWRLLGTTQKKGQTQGPAQTIEINVVGRTRVKRESKVGGLK